MSRAWKWNKQTRLYDPIEITQEEARNIAVNMGPRGRELWQNNPDHDGIHYSDYLYEDYKEKYK